MTLLLRISSISDGDKDYFIADTGAGKHMTFRRDFFSEFCPTPLGTAVKVADDRCLDAPGIGTITILENVKGVLNERPMTDVLYVPDLGCNLFSIGTINRKGFRCGVRDKDANVVGRGDPHGNIVRMLFTVKMPTLCNAVHENGQSMLNLWHARMGHVNVRAVKNTCKQFGIDRISHENFEFCEGCVLGKQTRKPHLSSTSVSNYGPGEKIHSDVCGPVNVQSPNATRFFLALKDENTSFRKVYFMRHKSEVFDRFKEFEAFVSTQLGTKIKVLRTDNGTEYTCGKLQSFLKEKGIIHEFSAPYIHEQNGRAEREIRTLVESTRSMLHAKKVDIKLCPEVVNTACYLLNRVISKTGETLTPFEKWFKRPPTIKHLKVFGSTAYLHLPKEKRQKFDLKSDASFSLAMTVSRQITDFGTQYRRKCT